MDIYPPDINALHEAYRYHNEYRSYMPLRQLFLVIRTLSLLQLLTSVRGSDVIYTDQSR